MKYTFEITITSRQNYTWQGELRTESGAYLFRSEIELLREMTRQIEEGDEEKKAGSMWEESRPLDAS